MLFVLKGASSEKGQVLRINYLDCRGDVYINRDGSGINLNIKRFAKEELLAF